MRNQMLKHAWILAAYVPTLALAQQQSPPLRGDGTWELSLSGGIKIMDRDLLDFLATGAPTTRFTNSTDPGRIAPVAVLRLGYSFSRHWGFSLGGEFATGSGVKYWTPLAAITYTANLNAKTSPFITGGTQVTRVVGQNGRLTHPTWGAHLGVGVRSMIGDRLALRVEGRVATEHYAELPGSKATYPMLATVGFSYFAGGRRSSASAAAAPPCPACTLGRGRVDTLMRVRLDTAWVTRADTVLLHEPSADQLILRVQFRTNEAELLRRSLPVLDTIAQAIIATPGSRWEVQGHTDSIGSAEANRKLAQARAESVANYLVSKGVDRNDLTAVGFGPDRPVFSNSSDYGRAQNRRVQLRRIPPPPTGRPVH